MEEWAEFSDKGNFWFNLDLDFPTEKCCFDSCQERLRSLFDQLLFGFMKEKSISNCFRPIPVLSGDGRPVDLLKLFWVVMKIGGHEEVSKNDMWGFVSEECGFGIGVVPNIELIHLTYLNELDQWLRQVLSKRNSENENDGLVRKLDLLSRELENSCTNLECGKFPGMSSEDELHLSPNGGSSEKSQCDNGHCNAHIICELNEACVYLDGSISDFDVSPKRVVKKSVDNDLSEDIIDDEDEERVGARHGIDNVIPDKNDSRKRKQQSPSFFEMLKWLTHVAKLPYDLSVGEITECSKWNEYGNDELWVQATLAREALLIRRLTNANANEDLLKDKNKKRRMHTSIYQNDALDHQSRETLRCSRRVPTSPKFQLYPCSNSDAVQSKTTLHQDPSDENTPKAPSEDIDELPKISNYPICSGMPIERQVFVGPLFQAQVPEWSGVISESDPKRLGTRMWPPKAGGKKSVAIGSEPVGKGRRDSCDCQFPNSVECFRFHIAEKRLKLKRELGRVFYRWHFDRMGEEVSLSWTEYEENKFKDMMRSYTSSPNKFWDDAITLLPSKTRDELVSYYFNVFLVHRRSYQNRVTPKDVDSDDDEKECGSIGGYFGYKALYVPGPSLVSCTLNKESYELV